jgi:translation initiation factor IF-3
MTIREKPAALPLMNERIPFPRLQLITHDGRNMGEVSRSQALVAAQEQGLDLVIIAEQGSLNVPVAKVMDFGKALYAKKKQLAEAKKHQKVIQVKEIQIRPKIGDHDFQTKIHMAIDFLNDGKRLKVTLLFRGREVMMKNERGTELFDKIHQAFDAAGLLKRLVQENDTKMAQIWSRVYYLK